MRTLFCPVCLDERRVRVREIAETYPVKNDPIEVLANVAFCEVCDNSIFNEELDEVNLETAFNAYRQKHGLLTSLEIQEILDKYALSQRGAAILLGWGEVTINRYLNGAIQSSAHNALLELLREPKNMQTIFEARRHDLPEFIIEPLEERLSNLVNGDIESVFEDAFSNIMDSHQCDLETGNKAFRLDVLENMVLYFTSQSDYVFKTKLNKLLWYADFANYSMSSNSISGSRYLAHHHGPVPEHYQLLFGEMDRRGLIYLVEKEFEGRDGEYYTGETVNSNSQCNTGVFSSSELHVLEYIANYFANYNSKQIRKLSHDELGYSETAKQDFISYRWADDLSIRPRESDEVPF